MDKMEKCRPDDSIIWATRSWLKTCSPRVLKEGGRKASGGPAKRCCRCVSLLFITVSDLDANTKGSDVDQGHRGHKAGRNNQYDEIKIEELTDIKMSSTGWNKELDQRKNWMGINVKSFI